MSFPRYQFMTASGVEWLGAVPIHWAVQPLKRHTRHLTEKTDRREHPVALENIEGWTGRFLPTETEFEGEGVEFEAGDVLFGKLRPYLAKTLVANSQGEAVGDFLVMRPSEAVLPAFLGYQLRSREVISIIDGSTFGSKMPRASWDFVGAMPFAIPPLDEQITIASFLDRETAKIDALVQEQKRLIELLKEKRQAIISQAVTKGLDPKVPMKDSGVEWLGEVPVHWTVGAVKRFFSVLDGLRIPLSSEERGERGGEFPYYGASGVIDWIDEFIFDEDLVLVSEDGANLLNRATPIAFVATGKYWVNNHAHILKPLDRNLVFWAARIEAIDLAPFVTGSAQPKLTIEALGNLMIAVPPDEAERFAIESHLLEQAGKLDPLIRAAADAMQLLQERRSALISAAVTGKIDVRGLVPQSEAVAA